MKNYQIISQIMLFCLLGLLEVSGEPRGILLDDSLHRKHPMTMDGLRAGIILDTVFCSADPAQSYAIYIPVKGDRSSLPLIYFFDAHGAGAHPLRKYRTLADEFGFILVGSNNSRNGNDWTTAAYIWQKLWEDSQRRLKTRTNRIYTCGFSGGAKVAGFVALKYPGVRGVIANGAGLPDGTAAGDFGFDFTSLAGQGDMNLTDLVAFSKDLDKSQTRHHLIVFEGLHEWAPEPTMRIAFAGLQLDAMAKLSIAKNKEFIDQFISQSKKRLNAFYQSNQLVKAGDEYILSISYLEGLSDQVLWFKKGLSTLLSDTRYQKQQQDWQSTMVEEQQTKAEYMAHFPLQDSRYWAGIVRDLRSGANAKRVKSAMDQRLLAYLSLAFYSFSNRLVNGNEDDAARYFVNLYTMVDPTNSEAWYLSAVLLARQGRQQESQAELLKAIAYGFRDENRFKLQREFQALFTPAEISRLENKMRTTHPGD
jgi:pimeloyl-ACP methyl ester carboxylesterase